jgi:uncharacterized membrane protein (GlpM family)
MKFQLNPIHWSVISYFTWLMNKKLYTKILFSSLEIESSIYEWLMMALKTTSATTPPQDCLWENGTWK